MPSLNVSVFGAGYVGLVTAVGLAELGHKVLCVEINSEKLGLLKENKCPIYEPGLEELLDKHTKSGSLHFTDSHQAAVAHGLVQFIAVGTPAAATGEADLSYVYEVAKQIGGCLSGSCVVVNKSTVPVGTGDQVDAVIASQLESRGVKIDYSVVSNPEFLREGMALHDVFYPDRIVIGVENTAAEKIMKDLYQAHADKIIVMERRAAELTKYAANAMLATKISFINEVSQLADRFDINVQQVCEGIGADHRIGPYFIQPGCGYGGSCFPKDVSAMIHMANSVDYQPKLLQAVTEVNQQQKLVLFDKLVSHYGSIEQLKGKVVAVWGLAFKPDTDDVRESPSLVLVEKLLQAGIVVQAYDPVATENFKKIMPPQSGKLCFTSTADEAIEGVDALLVVTNWQEFCDYSAEQLSLNLREKLVFDGRNCLDRALLNQYGVAYQGVGVS